MMVVDIQRCNTSSDFTAPNRVRSCNVLLIFKIRSKFFIEAFTVLLYLFVTAHYELVCMGQAHQKIYF